jgi:tetratricopeptide (TPR) repeat protein
MLFIVSGICLAQKNSRDNAPAKKFLELCKTNLEKGDADKAIYYGEEAVKLDENCSEYHYWLGQAYGQKAQEASIFKKFSYAKKCKAEWEKAVQLDGNNLDARFMLVGYHLQAPGIAGGDKNKAREQASAIAKIDPLRGHLAFAQIYEREKDFTKAEQEYIKIIEIDPKKTENHFYLGTFYQNQGKNDKAREIYLKILEMSPQEMSVYYQLGRIALFSGKDLEKGIDYFKEYLKVEPKPNSPTWADAHWRMGMIYEKLGDRNQAISEYQKALELAPDHKKAKGALKALKRDKF